MENLVFALQKLDWCIINFLLAIATFSPCLIENETSCKVIILSKLDKINENFIKKQVSPKGPIFVIEEASKFFGFGSELGSIFNEDQELKKRKFMRISSKDEIIPSSPKLEKNSIISSDLIKYNISKLIDA